MLLCGWLSATAMLFAQQPPVHYLHHGVMPPGAIGSQQLQRGRALSGYFQPVEIKAPNGALVSLAVGNQFDDAQATSRKAGFLIGAVYRLRVTNIRMAEGAEVFPTVEVIDRTYAPVSQQNRFPIPIELTEDDLKLALEGKFVTRVIYLEDPRQALPAQDLQSRNWFEAAPGQDPLAIADAYGRPVAILRLGARLPDNVESPDPSFFYGSPPFVTLPADIAGSSTTTAQTPASTTQAASTTKSTTSATPSTTTPATMASNRTSTPRLMATGPQLTTEGSKP
jgi:hypothetical protein